MNGHYMMTINTTKHGAAKFASNLKRTLRQAFGIVKERRNIDNVKSMSSNSNNKDKFSINDAINEYKKEMLSKLTEIFQTG